MTNKEKFKSFCENNDVLIFESYDWISTIANDDQWDVLLYDTGAEILGYMLIFKRQKYGITKITVPHLTPYFGVHIVYPPGMKQSAKTSHEKQVMNALLEQIPDYHLFHIHFNPNTTNWLPFFWAGYKQMTRYTYTISPKSVEELQANLKSNIRREIKKAAKTIVLEDVNEVNTLHSIKKLDYDTRGINLFYSQDYFSTIYSICQKKGQSRVVHAKNANGEVLGAMLFIWDHQFLYYYSGAVKPEFRNSGAMSLLMFEGLKMASEKNLTFNFEGSMVEGIERFFASFGAEQTPYFQITNAKPKWLNKLLA